MDLKSLKFAIDGSKSSTLVSGIKPQIYKRGETGLALQEGQKNPSKYSVFIHKISPFQRYFPKKIPFFFLL